MDTFKAIFYDVDKRGKKWVSRDELQEYMEEHELTEDFLKKWTGLFDPENTGRITLEKFCDVLGLELEEVSTWMDEEELRKLTIFDSDMPKLEQIAICRLLRKGVELNQNDDKKLVKFLTQSLQEKYGRLWHVFIIDGHYHACFTHVYTHNFCFSRNKRIYLFFKTPDTAGY